MIHILGTLRRTLLLPCLMVVLAAFDLFGIWVLHRTWSRPSKAQTRVAKDLAGPYEGNVVYPDESGKRYLMRGSARLLIGPDQTFTFTGLDGKELKGHLRTDLLTEKDLGVGDIRLDGQSTPIEIRWYRSPD